MISTATIYLSKKGMKELRKRIATLERNHSRELARLRELDKTDTHEGRLARMEQLASIEAIEAELEDKRAQLADAKPLPRKRDAIKVALGSVVELMDQQGRLMRYTIVNSIEANPSDGRISVLSPLGQSLLGKTAQQTVEWTSNKLQTNRLQLLRVM